MPDNIEEFGSKQAGSVIQHGIENDPTLAEVQRTTVPDFLPIGGGLPTTLPDRRDATDVKLASGEVLTPQKVSHSSFSGMLGRFQYLNTLGEGAFGIVIHVWDPELQAHRAIKVPHRNLIESKRVTAESYVSEARKLAQLGKHPGIVEVLDIQRMADGIPFVVSEFIPGGSLADKVSKGRLPWREAVTIIAQVADAIGYAHSKGVVHRDLKPANILINDDGKPIVVDFGLALSDEEFSHQNTVCGTYQYMSPQQVRGEADRVDGRSDIYSLGVILYQLVAGRLPYKSKSVKALEHEILHDDRTPLRQYNPEAPQELEQICQRAMAKQPAERYSTATDFAAALRALLKRDRVAETKAAAPAAWTSWLGPILLAAAGCAVVGASLFAILRKSDSHNALPGPGPAAVTTPNLEIHFQKAGKQTFSPSLADADLPLEAGDKLQFQVNNLPEPMFAYIYWIDDDGQAKRVWPSNNVALDQQQPVTRLSSPEGGETKSGDQPWWAIDSATGQLIFFLGLSKDMLNENQLGEFESQTSLMRESMLSELERSGRSVAEFEYPAQSKTYELRNNELFRTRGGNLHLVIAPKAYATDHTQLQKWFSAYHGWIVDAK